MPAKCPHTQLDSFIIPVGSEDSSVCSKTPQLSAIVPNQPGVFELRRDSGFLWNHETDTCHQLDPEQCGKYPQVFLRAIQDHFVHAQTNFTVQSGVRVLNTKPLVEPDQNLVCHYAVSRSKLPIRLGAGREFLANQPRRSSAIP